MTVTDICLLSASTGELIISHQYIKRSQPVLLKPLYQKLKNQSVPPTWAEEGITYHYIKRSGILFVAFDDGETSNNYVVLDTLSRLFHLCKDLIGSVNEESIKVNILMVQEVLMEIMDYGMPQLGTLKTIKPYIMSDVVMPKTTQSQQIIGGLFGLNTPSSAGSLIKVAQASSKNEVYLDVIENVSAVFSASGSLSSCSVSGSVVAKTFIQEGCQISVELPDDLQLLQGDGDQVGFGSGIVLKSWKLHKEVNSSEFEKTKALKYTPDEGEMTLLNYQLTDELPVNLPFRLFTKCKKTDRDVTLSLKLRSEIPPHAQVVKATLTVRLPKNIERVNSQTSNPSQSCVFDQIKKIITWTVQSVSGPQDLVVVLTMSSSKAESVLTFTNAIALEAELSKYCCSGMNIKHVSVTGHKEPRKGAIKRWIRYATLTDSYLFEFS